MSAESKNTSGQAYSLTVLAPISSGRSSDLAAYLDELGSGDASPLSNVPSTHFARWAVLDTLVYEGGRQRRDAWSAPRLLFTSNFDGALDPYLDALRTGLGEVADAIWGHCAGYPGRAGAAPFAAWMRAHQVTSSLFFAAYGEQTVEHVLRNLELRQWLMQLAVDAPGLSPSELKAAFLERWPQ